MNLFFGWLLKLKCYLTKIQTFLYNVKKLPKPCSYYMGRREKTCLQEFANNKGADQPAHPHSRISALVICFLESTISKLATSEISIF